MDSTRLEDVQSIIRIRRWNTIKNISEESWNTIVLFPGCKYYIYLRDHVG